MTQGDVTRQGLLLARGDIVCVKPTKGVKWRSPKPSDCQMFVFQEIIIVCCKTPSPYGTAAPVPFPYPQLLDFKTSFQVSLKFLGNNRSNHGVIFIPHLAFV